MSKTNSNHDLRGFYRKGELPKHARFAAVEIEDPYADAAWIKDDGSVDLEARDLPGRGWTPPPRPTITVIRSLKDDPLGRMHSRHQIAQYEFLAGRKYQEFYVAAQLSRCGSLDVGGGGGRVEPLTEPRQRALRNLHEVDKALATRYGAEGVLLVRDVLGEGLSIDAAARRRASTGERNIRSWGWLFRRCLNVIAYKVGYASTTERARKR